METAIVLNGNDVIKVTNLKRKRLKIENNPLMKILEEFNTEIPEDRFLFWLDKYPKIEKEIQSNLVWKNSPTYYIQSKITKKIIPVSGELNKVVQNPDDWVLTTKEQYINKYYGNTATTIK